MNRRLPSLRALVAFEAAARHGSFTAAAEELHVTPSAISHQIRTLEGLLGILVFQRDHYKATLTEGGRIYLRQIVSALTCIDQATTTLRQDNEKEVLQIHSAPSFAAKWLMPRLSCFLDEHPGTLARVNATTAPPDLESGAVDVSICYGWLTSNGARVEPLARERIEPLCSPRLLGWCRERITPASLCGYTLIHSQNTVRWHEWLSKHGVEVKPDQNGLIFDRSHMAIDAAVEGMGIILESDLLTEREVADGRLVPAIAGYEASEKICSYFLVQESGEDITTKTRPFVSWMRRELGAADAGNIEMAPSTAVL